MTSVLLSAFPGEESNGTEKGATCPDPSGGHGGQAPSCRVPEQRPRQEAASVALSYNRTAPASVSLTVVDPVRPRCA